MDFVESEAWVGEGNKWEEAVGLKDGIRIRDWIEVFELGRNDVQLNKLIELRTKVCIDTFKFSIRYALLVKKANRMPTKIKGNINNTQYFPRASRKTKDTLSWKVS